MKKNRYLFAVGGTGGGPVTSPFREELWLFLISTCFEESVEPKIGLLATPSTLSPPALSGAKLFANHQALEEVLGCSFLLMNEEEFGEGRYASEVDLVCVTCGNTAGALEEWRRYGCDLKLRELYQAGMPLTGYSAGFIAFFERASTDSVPGPAGARFGAMAGVGFLPGGAVPHAATQRERVPDFKAVLKDDSTSPALVLGEEVMAQFENETLIRAVSPLDEPTAGWLTSEGLRKIEVQGLSFSESAGSSCP